MQPDIDELIICTSTCYPIKEMDRDLVIEDIKKIESANETSTLRMQLALNMFRNVAKIGASCILTDGGSGEYFFQEIEKINEEAGREVIRVIPEPPVEGGMLMGESRRLAFFSAFGGTIEEWNNGDRDVSKKEGVSYCLWTEPEKADLITKENLEGILVSFKEQKAEIIVPARLQEGWDTLPKKQAWIEKRANKEAAKIVNSEQFDLWFGPKAFSRKGSKFFLESKGPRWEGLMEPVHTAIQEGVLVTSVPVKYEYDARQKEMEEVKLEGDFFAKRVIQYAEIQAFLGNRIWRDIGDEFLATRSGKEKNG